MRTLQGTLRLGGTEIPFILLIPFSEPRRQGSGRTTETAAQGEDLRGKVCAGSPRFGRWLPRPSQALDMLKKGTSRDRRDSHSDVRYTAKSKSKKREGPLASHVVINCRTAKGVRSCRHTAWIAERAVNRPDGSPPPGIIHWPTIRNHNGPVNARPSSSLAGCRKKTETTVSIEDSAIVVAIYPTYRDGLLWVYHDGGQDSRQRSKWALPFLAGEAAVLDYFSE